MNQMTISCGKGIWASVALAFIWSAVAPRVAHAQCMAGTPSCVQSVTYGATPLTFYGSADAANVRTEIWYLVNPATGSSNVVVTLGVDGDVTASAVSFSGVDQGAPLGSLVTMTGTGTAVSATSSSAAGEGVVDVVGACGTTAPVADSAQIVRQTNDTSTGTKHVVLGTSTKFGTASTTTSWTIAEANWAYAVAPVKAFSGLTDVGVISFAAQREPAGVQLNWETGYQPRSLGYFVYRQLGGGERVAQNQDIIDGDALVGPVSAFSWFDYDIAWGEPVAYWLKETFLDGTAIWHGPTSPPLAPSAAPTATAPTVVRANPPASARIGCQFGTRPSVFNGFQLIGLVFVIAWYRRRLRPSASSRLLLPIVFISTMAAYTGVAWATGGITFDASSSGTGRSGLTFSQNVGAGSNRLLIVTVVLPVNAPEM